MVQIKIKGVNQTYHVFAVFDDFSMFILELTKRLSYCSQKQEWFKAFFHLPLLDHEQCKALLQICEENHTMILGMNELEEKMKIDICEETIYNGENRHFITPVLLIGNIMKQSYVSSYESLYVFGSVKGSIDLFHDDCVLYANLLQANIRICDSAFQNMTSFSPAKVYYEEGNIKLQLCEEETMWEKQ